MRAKTRHLKNRKIVAVEWRPFKAGYLAATRTTYDPILYLDNGTALIIDVDETEVGRYGVHFQVIKALPPQPEETA